LTVIVQSGVPRVQTTALLADGRFVGLMRSGFPLRLHYRLELWRSRSGWFDQYITEAPWDAVARHDPLADDFVLIRTGGSVARYGTPEDRQRRFADADVALRAVVGLEAGEQRAMPEMPGALAMTMDAVEHLGSPVRSRVRLGGSGRLQDHAERQHPLGGHARPRLGVHHRPGPALHHEQPHNRHPGQPRDDPGSLLGHNASRVASTSPP